MAAGESCRHPARSSGRVPPVWSHAYRRCTRTSEEREPTAARQGTGRAAGGSRCSRTPSREGSGVPHSCTCRSAAGLSVASHRGAERLSRTGTSTSRGAMKPECCGKRGRVTRARAAASRSPGSSPATISSFPYGSRGFSRTAIDDPDCIGNREALRQLRVRENQHHGIAVRQIPDPHGKPHSADVGKNAEPGSDDGCSLKRGRIRPA